VVVFFEVGDKALASGVSTADPDATLHLDGDHKIRPCEVETPLAGGVESVLRNRLGQAEAAKDLGEGHAWGGAYKERRRTHAVKAADWLTPFAAQ